jgi:ribose 5-phosphate isomerase RpiB
VVAGDVVADSTDRAVAVEGIGGGMWVAKNMW